MEPPKLLHIFRSKYTLLQKCLCSSPKIRGRMRKSVNQLFRGKVSSEFPLVSYPRIWDCKPMVVGFKN